MAGLAMGAALEVAGRRHRWVPSASAMGMGFIAPAYYAAAICAGGLVTAAWRRVRPAAADELAPVAGAGAITGEAMAGALAAALVASGMVARQ
jgi:uncharacterized oligopeptide transporter (OPT) family protein